MPDRRVSARWSRRKSPKAASNVRSSAMAGAAASETASKSAAANQRGMTMLHKRLLAPAPSGEKRHRVGLPPRDPFLTFGSGDLRGQRRGTPSQMSDRAWRRQPDDQ